MNPRILAKIDSPTCIFHWTAPMTQVTTIVTTSPTIQSQSGTCCSRVANAILTTLLQHVVDASHTMGVGCFQAKPDGLATRTSNEAKAVPLQCCSGCSNWRGPPKPHAIIVPAIIDHATLRPMSIPDPMNAGVSSIIQPQTK
ncbi:hypothetical protein KC351_g102 [Hortaea werneckii]|nr:hypothetical protein KC351_g102 [Hortaea werneckii]